jgi:hypothetical protein
MRHSRRAFAPRDGTTRPNVPERLCPEAPEAPPSYPRKRVSSTPRPIDSIADVSGTLDRPLSRTTTVESAVPSPNNHGHASSLRSADRARDFSKHVRPFGNRGRGECRVPSAPAAPCALGSEVCARVFTAEAPEITRHSRTRMVLTAYGALSPATNSSCHRRRRIDGLARPVGLSKDLRRLDTSNGCQDHTLLPYALAFRKSRSTGLVPVPPKL